MAGSRRVLMLGLDALDLTLLERLCDQGRLPNIAAFRNDAQRLTVSSDGELLHGSIWPTFASGTGPGTHGVYFWLQWLAEEQRHVRNSHRALSFEPFWSGLPRAGRRATVIDVPYVPLVRGPGLRGVVGWGLHDEGSDSEPAGFRREIERSFGHNPLSFDTVEPLGPAAKLHLARRMRVGVKRRAALVEALAAGRDWDLFITTFAELHMAGHYLSSPQELSARTSNESAMAAILRPLDSALPAIVAAAGTECDIFLFALHGMQEQADYSYFAPQLIDTLAGRPTVDRGARPDLLRRLRSVIPGPVRRAVWRRIPVRLRVARQGALSAGGMDTITAPLFPTPHDGPMAFRLNLAGRERDGTVSPEEGTRLISELDALAASFVADDGQAAFMQLVRPASRWQGPRLSRLPDALVPLNPRVRGTCRLRSDGLVLNASHQEARNGAHTDRGFCYIRPGGPLELSRTRVEPRDFAPAILGLLNVPLPPALEGESFIR